MTVTLAPLHVCSLQQTSSVYIVVDFFSDCTDVVMIVVEGVIIIYVICMVVAELVSAAAVDLWAVVAFASCRPLWQRVDWAVVG